MDSPASKNMLVGGLDSLLLQEINDSVNACVCVSMLLESHLGCIPFLCPGIGPESIPTLARMKWSLQIN